MKIPFPDRFNTGLFAGIVLTACAYWAWNTPEILVAPASAQTTCVVPANAPGVPVVLTQSAGALALKASPGCLLSVYVTTSGSAGYLMVFNSAQVPADGAVLPRNCVFIPATSSSGLNWAPQPPEFYSSGITVAFSTTGCFTKTITPVSFIHGLVQ